MVIIWHGLKARALIGIMLDKIYFRKYWTAAQKNSSEISQGSENAFERYMEITLVMSNNL